ncbi:hypothetical protein [Thomasclavelia cocleata]|uniref:hypothetical protein n=1 Tax=Thomasclavelia cocleata TaxID=69824 RepID=UPI00242CCE52|nr:hypothetical protein [Thomasclavelia cocleata]
MNIYRKIGIFTLLLFGISFTLLLSKGVLLEAVHFMFFIVVVVIKDICIDANLDESKKTRAVTWIVFSDLLGITLALYDFVFTNYILGVVQIILIVFITYIDIKILKK